MGNVSPRTWKHVADFVLKNGIVTTGAPHASEFAEPGTANG